MTSRDYDTLAEAAAASTDEARRYALWDGSPRAQRAALELCALSAEARRRALLLQTTRRTTRRHT